MDGEFLTLPVVRFVICNDAGDDDEEPEIAGFDAADELLEKLRAENTDTTYWMMAEIDA